MEQAGEGGREEGGGGKGGGGDCSGGSGCPARGSQGSVPPVRL